MSALKPSVSYGLKMQRRGLVSLARQVAGPRAVVVLLVSAVALCLTTLIYVQHTANLIVSRDMQTAVSLSELAARFDHEDGNLYRLMVDTAANGQSAANDRQLAAIQGRIARIDADLSVLKRGLEPAERRRAQRISVELHKYSDAVTVVSSMLEINFAASVAMLRPFRVNADNVLAEIKGIAASGIADASRHAEAAAWRTRLLVAVVTGAVLIVAGLSYIWLALAAERGKLLRSEIRRRDQAEQEALQLARTDPLTGLFNRRVFGEELHALIEADGAESTPLTIVLIDLDGFKGVNDTYGHAAGDAVLTTIGQRLRASFEPGGIIARLGGDEFAVLLPGYSAQGELPSPSSLERARQALCQPLSWRANTISVGASIGVSCFPADGARPSELLHAADIAMYEAKRSPGRGVCLFAPWMEQQRLEQRQLEDELRVGIANGELRPYYQPIVRLIDQTLCGFEVLARWQHPRLGLLTPDRFLRIAERSGQITDMTRALLGQACSDALMMPEHLRLAINISPTQLEEPGLAETLIEIIRVAGVRPSRIEIEITEDAVMDDVATAERVLQTFRASGVSIALDDFGTGYSSLSNLRRLKFDKIKIDQIFVKSLATSVESEKLVDAILGLALSFDMKITAEGIEDAAAAEMLARKGCTQGQGWLFGKPACVDQTLALIDLQPRAAA